MSRPKKGSKEPGFEEALARLETIVKNLEDGELPLEESLRLFEEGVRLTRLCTTRLDDAQRRIEILTTGEQGELKLAPFEIEGDEPPGERGPERT
ncbi:MAG TPA: exodeoxyribonuclease VII small subunit [Candidatus Polarisedimenticolia bacterium]|nr:exodeoxyribonuclease VII small subunit [Candidatus Polarisedimenticolia bacterium]